MSKMTHCFFIFLASATLVACGSRPFRVPKGEEGSVVCPVFVELERERVMPHLNYSLDVHSIDRGTIELSFCFVKEQGDSLLWVECVERVPMELVDTALCHRWFDYDYIR